MLSHTVMGVVDTLMVAWLGTVEVAAVGLASTAFFALVCLGLGGLGGVRVVVAQALGRGDDVRIRDAGWQGVAVAAVLGILMIPLVWVCPGVMTFMTGGGPATAPATEYLEVRLWGALPMLLSVGALAWFEGRGETRVPMVVRILGNGINLSLNWVLIFGVGPFPELGVAGAAWGTVVAQLFQAVLALALLWRHEAPRFTTRGLGELMRLGGPMGLQWALDVQCWAMFCALVARTGDVQMAAHTIVLRIVSVSFLPGHAFGDAASILTGQAHGAKAWGAARRVVNTATWVSAIFMGSIGLLFLIDPELLLSLFRPEHDVMALGVRLLTIAALFQVVDGVVMARQGALNGIGDTRFVMMASVGTSWGLLLPTAWFLCTAMGLGAVGAWMSLMLQLVALSVIYWRRWDVMMPAVRDTVAPCGSASTASPTTAM